ncbi:acid phosphatase [Enterobacter hormaechei]|uniref:acid phosphatase n=1 Tax=Enterobacter hormaechei TaxID=158836 RepID=UPI0032DA54A6
MNIKILLVSGFINFFLFTSSVEAVKIDGFLTEQTAPDSAAILPPPPDEDSVAFQADKARYESGRILRNPARTKLAAEDAHYKHFGQAFSSAFGMEISENHTPELYHLISKVLQDSHDYAMRGAKERYKRLRPFVFYKDTTCTPQKDSGMAVTGSYPSGHASFGWVTALILAEINPERATEIIQRGYEFGESRVVCGAHWQSDVDAGRIMGAVVIAALHANPEFENQLQKAKKEFLILNVKKEK